MIDQVMFVFLVKDQDVLECRQTENSFAVSDYLVNELGNCLMEN